MGKGFQWVQKRTYFLSVVTALFQASKVCLIATTPGSFSQHLKIIIIKLLKFHVQLRGLLGLGLSQKKMILLLILIFAESSLLNTKK